MSESQHKEWKASWRDEYLKWICGFANAEGGVLTIGRDDNGEDVGIPNAEHLFETLPNKVRDVLGIIVDVNLLEGGGAKQLIEIVVEPYPYPISYKGQYHYRTGSTKQELKGAALDKFLLQKQGKRWDGVPIPKVAPDDLKQDTFKHFRQLAANSQRVDHAVLGDNNAALLDSLHLLDGSHLKRAALLLFHPQPEKFVTGAYLKMGFFETDDDLRYQDEVHGNLFEQVSGAFDLLRTKYMKAEIQYQGEKRIEALPYPEAAIREALLNAIVHKDYASGIPIQISVYASHIMFWNSGQLPVHWTVERLTQKHPSKPNNPDIANAFFRAGLIESWGRGTLKIISECAAADLPAPEYRYQEPDFLLTLFAQTPVQTPVQTLVQTLAETSGQTLVEAPGKTPDLILSLLKQDKMLTIPQLAEAIGKSQSAIERAVRKLRLEGKLQRIGATKGGSWKVVEPKQ